MEKDMEKQGMPENNADNADNATSILTKLTEEFEKEVTRWTKDIRDMSSKVSGHAESINEAQSLALSYRQQLAETVSTYTRRLAKQSSKMKVLRRGKFVYYATGILPNGTRPDPETIRRDQHIISLKKTKSEMDLIISGDLSDNEHYMELLEQHIFFLRECIKTVDHCLYSIKNRIELMTLMLNIS